VEPPHPGVSPEASSLGESVMVMACGPDAASNNIRPSQPTIGETGQKAESNKINPRTNEAQVTTEGTPRRFPAPAAPHGVEPPTPGVSPGASSLGESVIVLACEPDAASNNIHPRQPTNGVKGQRAGSNKIDPKTNEAQATTEDTPERSPAPAAPPGVEPPTPGVSAGVFGQGESYVNIDGFSAGLIVISPRKPKQTRGLHYISPNELQPRKLFIEEPENSKTQLHNNLSRSTRSISKPKSDKNISKVTLETKKVKKH
jgi:hypothetical protein